MGWGTQAVVYNICVQLIFELCTIKIVMENTTWKEYTIQNRNKILLFYSTTDQKPQLL